MKTSLAELLPDASRTAAAGTPHPGAGGPALSHGTMTLGPLTPPRAGGAGEPPLQDTLFILASGSARLALDGEDMDLAAGDAVFVRAGTAHGFSAVSDDFAGWTVAWGPAGGEAPAPDPSVFAAIDA